jgi:hypothetical protein
VKRLPLASLLIFTLVIAASAERSARPPKYQQSQPRWAVVLHGGAGVVERSSMSPDAERQYRDGLDQAIAAAG